MQTLSRIGGVADARPLQTLTLFFILCVLAYLATIPLPRVDGMLIGSDGVGYYMYVRSLVIDHDLDFTDEYAHLYPQSPPPERTPTGIVGNQYAIGPGLLWAPFFIVAHLLSLALHAINPAVTTDGYSYLYQAAISLGSIVYGFIGLVLVYKTISRDAPRRALVATLLLWFATNVVYYMLVEPSMSHMCSLMAVSLLVYLWLSARPLTTMRQFLLLGLAGGLVGIVRQPDATLLLLPVLDTWLGHQPVLAKLKGTAVIGVGFIAIFWVQMLAWLIQYGSPFSSGYLYGGKQFFTWLTPHLFEVLFSTEHGLYLWHPVLLLATVGLVLVLRRDRVLGSLLFLGLGMQAYLIGAWSVWDQGDSFGGRMFIASLPILAPGLAAILEWAWDHRARAIALVGAVVLVVWNGLFLLQYRLGYISMSGPYTLDQLILGKLYMFSDLFLRIAHLIRR
ncbi:MAG: hypothetical protein WCF84_20190 [Anaerolineae bacterium]